MSNQTFARKIEVLDLFKQAAERSVPDSVDFSERIMARIHDESAPAGGGLALNRHPRRRKAYLAAAVVLSVVLLSGFTYAAVEGWLTLRDRNGNTVMQVNRTDWEISAQQNRIMDLIRSKLNPGESAVIVFGREAVDAAKRGEPPKSISTVTRGVTYPSAQAAATHLRGALGAMHLPADTILGARLTEVELIPEAGTGVVTEADRWQEAIDAETGEPYAYQTGGVSDIVSIVHFNFADENATYQLGVGVSSLPTLQFYDKNPSSSQIYEIAGTQVYNYKDKDADYLIWSRPNDGGSFIYSLQSSPVDLSKQTAFAEAVIHGYTER